MCIWVVCIICESVYCVHVCHSVHTWCMSMCVIWCICAYLLVACISVSVCGEHGVCMCMCGVCDVYVFVW